MYVYTYTMKEDMREIKGKQIALKADILRISDNHYHVQSQTSKRLYNVVKIKKAKNKFFVF